ncbi:MAG: FecR family protein [Phycisphaerae bacterium]
MKKSDKETIKRVLDNVSSKDEATNVVDWFANTVEGQNCLSEMIDRDSYLMEEELVTKHSITLAQSNKILAKIKKDIHKRTIKRNLFKIAAVLLPFVALLSLGFYLNKQVDLFDIINYSEIYVPKGETMRILFQDGSEAYLNSDTKLLYPDKFGLKNRKIYLEGEAYFNVSSNKKRPFIIEADKTTISVLGTSFNVEAYSDEGEIKVVLDEGEIVFNTNNNDYSILPGQKIAYTKSNGSITIVNLIKTSNESIWKNDVIYFKNTPLNEVIKTLNRRYDINFIVNSPSALKYTYTLSTKQTTIEDILVELEKIAPVKFHLNDNKIDVDL